MITINWKDPIHIASILILAVFVFSMIILYIFPPSCVKRINITTGKEYIRWQMVLLYSAIFGLAAGICGLLVSSKMRGPLELDSTKYANEQP